MKTDAQIKNAIDRHADTVKRICIMYVRNAFDMDDMFQNTFLKYALSSKEFASEEHEKAWIIRVCINCCKDFHKSYWRKSVDFDDSLLKSLPMEEEGGDVLRAVRALPGKYRNAIYLYYYEGYKAKEIAAITGSTENTVYSMLARGRERLKLALGGNGIEG